MHVTPELANRRMLIVDDTRSIHRVFRRILAAPEHPPRETGRQRQPRRTYFELDSAYDGPSALEMVKRAFQQRQPYAVAIVDVRMPGGWDGIETLERIWEVDPDLQAVLSTAFTGYSWAEVIDRLGETDRLLILQKPFEDIELRQIAVSLTRKWLLERQSRYEMGALHRQLDERTQEMLEAREQLLMTHLQFDQARSSADTANQAKSAFLANVCHEIRTPMTAILGFADFLLEEGNITDAPDDRVEAIDTIRRNGKHLLDVINDILDISKIEANKLDVERISCSPHEIVSEVMTLMRGRAESKGLTLESQLDEPIPETIETDPTRLRQILVNLVGNAIKFTEQGSVNVRTRLLAENPQEKPLLEISVLDTGIGMSSDQLANLFEPFAQADVSTARRFGGTGLGLSISQRLAQLLGGELHIESQLGRGSTFRVTVETGPIGETVQPRRPPAELGGSDPRCDVEALTSVELTGRILLAEDGPDNQRLLAHLLRKAGAEVSIVENGEQACELVLRREAEGQPFDLILMDMQMPVLDGYEAARRLREAGCTRPIIALTAFCMTGDRERCLAIGCNDYITKPIDRTEFLQAIQRAGTLDVPAT